LQKNRGGAAVIRVLREREEPTQEEYRRDHPSCLFSRQRLLCPQLKHSYLLTIDCIGTLKKPIED
jgi:hypothetical protein